MKLPIDRDLLHRVLEAIPGFIIVVDVDRVIRYVNRVEPGYDPDELIGTDSIDILFQESRDVHTDAMDRALNGGEVVGYEVEIQLPDGSMAWYASEVTPLFEREVVVGAVIRADNVTELKTTQEALAQVRKLLSMCAWCGRIRTEEGTWETINSYLERVERTEVSHGLCPTCAQKQFGLAEGAPVPGRP